jgi:hypothetical protein
MLTSEHQSPSNEVIDSYGSKAVEASFISSKEERFEVRIFFVAVVKRSLNSLLALDLQPGCRLLGCGLVLRT